MTPDQIAGSFSPPDNTVVDRLRYRAEHHGQRRAFTYLVDGEDEQVHLSYGELDRLARGIAQRLLAMGMQGERALLLYPSGLEFISAFFGCLYAGVVAVPAYPPRRNRNMDRIQTISDDAQAKLALTVSQDLERVQGMLDEAPHLKSLTWLSTDNIEPTMADDWKNPNIDGDHLAILQYTSGSTGTPKGVMLTHTNLMHNSALISYAFEHTRSSKAVFWLPLYHDMGLIGGILQPMYIGQPNILLNPTAFLQKPFRWLRAISKHRATISGGPNFAYDLCVRKITPQQREQLDLTAWNLAFNGAEPVRSESIDQFVETFGPCGLRREAFYPCYGMAEATLIIAGGLKTEPPVIRTVDGDALDNHQVVDATPDEENARELVGCGGNLPDQEMRIVDPNTLQAVPDDQVGEIWVRGPSVAQGYFNNHQATEDMFNAHVQGSGDGPYLRTGDLGFMHDGELFVTGRIKDLLIIRGVNRYPQDLERTAETAHPMLREGGSAAFTIEIDGSDKLALVLEAVKGRDTKWSDVVQAIRRDVAGEHDVTVDAVALIRRGTIPKTSSGKIQRHACAKAFAEGDLSHLHRWANWERAVPAKKPSRQAAAAGTNGTASIVIDPRTAEVVMEQIRAVGKTRAANLTLDTNIVQLGLDSLERIEIVAALEETFGGRFPEEALPRMRTCREVIQAVQKHLGTEPKPPAEAPRQRTLEAIPEEDYRLDNLPEYEQLRRNLAVVSTTGLPDPFFKMHSAAKGALTKIDGRQYTNYTTYNYLGMARDPAIIKAAHDALDSEGTSVSASRLVSGERDLHRQLERGIADLLQVADAMVFVGEHTAMESTLGHLLGSQDLILHDVQAHSGIVQGAALSGAQRRHFAHNDAGALDQLLAELRPNYRRVLVAIEGVSPMDGDIAQLPEFIEVKRRHKALLAVNESHALGTLGKHGRGTAEHFGADAEDVDLWLGSLGNSLGSCGGFVAGCSELIEYLKFTAPGFVYNVAMPPATAAATVAALKLMDEEPDRVARVQARSGLFRRLAMEQELNVGPGRETPVIPIITGNTPQALKLSHGLLQRGFCVQPIVYPAVDEAAARLRFFVTAMHTPEQIRYTVEALGEELARIAADPADASLVDAVRLKPR